MNKKILNLDSSPSLPTCFRYLKIGRAAKLGVQLQVSEALAQAALENPARLLVE